MEKLEEHLVTARLRESRERLRTLLLPDPRTGHIEANVFPRSKVMRLVFNPRARRVALAGISVATMLAGQRHKARVARSVWPAVARSLGRLTGLARH